MGRTRIKTKRNERVLSSSSSNVNASKSNQPSPSIPALYEKAESLVEQCDYELAAKFLKRVLDIQSSHIQARELLGIVLIELGDISAASQSFERLIASIQSPNDPALPSAYLHLAQLSEDPRKALSYYQKAVEVLRNNIQRQESAGTNDTQSPESPKQTLAKALVAMTEIWLTDLCMEPEAEQNCDSLLGLAIQVDPGNVEVLQSLASVRMSQQRPEDAQTCVLQAWGLWKDLPADDANIPIVPTRLALTRLFLELTMFKEALIVLTGIIATDDQEVEAWYLEGWCFMLMAEDAKEKNQEIEGLSWKELAQDARDCLDTCVSLFESQNHPDREMLSHTQELIMQLEGMGIKPSQADVEDGDAAEDWEDVDESDDDVEMRT